MRRVGVLGSAMALGLVALAFTSPSASATVLCKTGGNPCSSEMYATGTEIEAGLKSGTNTVLETKVGNVECSGLTTVGKTTNTGGNSENVSGVLTTLTFSGCNATVTTLKNGSFSISSANGEPKLTMEGFEITVESKGSHCIFAGTATFSLQGGEVASGEGAATIARTGGRSGATCGSTARWATAFTIAKPHNLFFEASRAPVALCSNSSNPCTGGTYGKGTIIEAGLKSGTKWVLNAAFGEVHCTEASVKGEITAAGEEGGMSAPVSGTVTALSFGECNCGVKVLQKGKFSVGSSSGGVGTLTLEGPEVTTECLTYHCIWRSSALSTTLNGGAMASVSADASIPRTGGTSSSTECGSSGTWKAEYTVTAPEPLYVAEQDASATVLCKTATNPCTGGTYGKGTTFEASLPTGVSSVLHPPIGNIECSESTIKGEVIEGTRANASGSLSSYSLGKCNAEVKVLRSGTFSIESPKEGNATIRLTGFETTVELLGFHCIFATNNTSFGTLTGGAMATIDIVSTFPRVAGRSGAFCGSTAQWTGQYTVSAPEPLYVEES